jgi:hypothetical protein
MPWDQVMSKYKAGTLKSGGDGKTVTNPQQAKAILMSEKREAEKGKKEYQAHSKGGEVCASTAKPFKQNVLEAEINPTGSVGLEKGGYVKPKWRRW